MRPQGLAHAGFYPAPEGLIKKACEYLVTDVPEQINALDPCVGEGVAFKQLLDHLAAPYERACASELTRNRGEAAAKLLPGANVLWPADFIMGTNQPTKCFSFVYCNSPYADELGGGYRVEAAFADKATRLLANGGIGLFVVPEKVWRTDYEFRRCIAKNFIDVMDVYAEQEFRPYNETLIFGVRKDHGIADWNGAPVMQMKGDHTEPYVVPGLKHPCRNWHRTQLTHDEIVEALLCSEIEQYVDVPAPIKRGTPPLALGEGHNGMLVASGQAPPVVVMRDKRGRMLEIPHLVRGVSKKVVVHVDSEEGVDDKGAAFKKDVYSETFQLDMVVLTHTGEVIHLKHGSAGASEEQTNVEIPPDRIQVLADGGTQTGMGGIAV